MKNKAQKSLNEIKEKLYEVEENDDWDIDLELRYNPIEGESLNKLIDPIQTIIDNYQEWIPFTFDEEGNLNCELPDDGETILASDGEKVVIDTFTHDCKGDWLEGLAWMRLPKPHKDISKLIFDIDHFFKDSDPYEYQDSIEDERKFLEDLKSDLETKDFDYVVDYLNNYIKDDVPAEEIVEAKRLLAELKKL